MALRVGNAFNENALIDKDELVSLETNDDDPPVLEAALQYFFRQRVLDEALNSTFERSGTEGRVEAIQGDVILGLRLQLQGDAPFNELGVKPVD